MRIRDGLVSNSSSSSFVAIIRKDAWDREFEKLSELQKHILSQVAEVDHILGCDCMVIGDMSNAGGYSLWDDVDIQIEDREEKNDDDDDDDYDEISVFETVDDFIKLFPEGSGEVWTHVMDM